MSEATASNLSVEHINPFVNAAAKALAVMAGITATRTKLTLKENDDAAYDLSGVLGLAGEVVGSVVLSFPHDTALRVISKFLGVEKAEMDSEVHSAIGELTNMVAGGAKKELAAIGLGFKIGIPSVVVGPDHKVIRPTSVPTVCVHFTCDEGNFVLEVCLKRADGAAL